MCSGSGLRKAEGCGGCGCDIQAVLPLVGTAISPGPKPGEQDRQDEFPAFDLTYTG